MNKRSLVRHLFSCVLLAANLEFTLGSPAASQNARPPEDTTPIYDVPLAKGIKIDGDGADWKEAGFRVEIMPDMDGRTQPRASFEPSFRLAWDTRGLLVLMKVHDDVFVETAKESSLWEMDSVEIFAAAERGAREYYSLVISPGMAPEFPEMRIQPIGLRRKDPRAPLSYEAARTKLANGYVLEALLPWANLGITPRRGAVLAFQAHVNDSDGPHARSFSVELKSGRQPIVRAFSVIDFCLGLQADLELPRCVL